MMGQARRHIRCVSMLGKAYRREGAQGAHFSRLVCLLRLCSERYFSRNCAVQNIMLRIFKENMPT